MDKKFEPKYGKDAVARAMLYFSLKYTDEIEASHKKEIDVSLLLKWHEDFIFHPTFIKVITTLLSMKFKAVAIHGSIIQLI